MTDSIYRYRSISSPYFEEEIERGIFRGEIFFSRADIQNDPFEFIPNLGEASLREVNQSLKMRFGRKPIISPDVLREISDKMASRSEFRYRRKKLRPSVGTARLYIKTCKEYLQNLPAKNFLACFSDKRDSSAMLGHYADNHRGVVVGYKVDWDQIYALEGVSLYPVQCAEKRPLVTFSNVMEAMDHSVSSSSDASSQEYLIQSLFLTKSNEWGYEQEWRLISYNSSGYVVVPGLTVTSIDFGYRACSRAMSKIRDKYSSRIHVGRFIPKPDVYGFSRENLS